MPHRIFNNGSGQTIDIIKLTNCAHLKRCPICKDHLDGPGLHR